MTLWRPTGLAEAALIFDSGMRAYPPRLPDQPIFYPVLNRGYAEQIARDWNTKETTAVGYVTRYELPDSFAERYQRQVVGGSEHEEWWIPAEELSAMNDAIQGTIHIEGAYFGTGFRGLIPTEGGLRGRDAVEQFVSLAGTLAYSSFDAWCETYVNRKAVYLHFLFWQRLQPEEHGLTEAQKAALMEFIRHRWSISDIPFPLP